jgi:hypothetical protein
MINLPSDAIQEFMDIYQQEFGVVIEPNKAIEMANALLNITSLIIKQEPYETAKP